MFEPEKNFHNVTKKLPDEGQRVLAFNNKLDQFIDAVFKNGKFYENGHELINITGWIENKDNIEY